MTITREFNTDDQMVFPNYGSDSDQNIRSLFDDMNDSNPNNMQLQVYQGPAGNSQGKAQDPGDSDGSDDTSETIDDKRKRLYVRGLSGLQNIGNTCYMNSILQCLNSIMVFNSWLRKRKYNKRLRNNKLIELSDKKRKRHKLDDNAPVKILANDLDDECEKTVTFRLSQLFDRMWKGNCTITPRSFKTTVGKLCPTFRGSNQEDSHELLNFVLDRIHEETKAKVTLQFYNIPESVVEFINVRERCSKIVNSFSTTIDQKAEASDFFKQYRDSHPNENAILMAYMYWKRYIQNSHSIITELFTGMYYSKVTCSECKSISNTFEPFTTIAVPTKDYGETTLAECLTDFSKQELLTGVNSYKCKRCKKNVNATKTMYIWEPPEVLIIQLIRFKNNGRYTSKTNSKVTFPIYDLTLNNNFTNIHNTDNCKYDLWAISEHRGASKEFGHYVAYGKNSINNKWYEFNDSAITHIPDNDLDKEVITQNAYMLIYVRNRESEESDNDGSSDYSDFSSDEDSTY